MDCAPLNETGLCAQSPHHLSPPNAVPSELCEAQYFGIVSCVVNLAHCLACDLPLHEIVILLSLRQAQESEAESHRTIPELLLQML